MRLVHRVPLLDPHGGRWGLGAVEAEADVAPDDWYLTCHFVDDRVMPGTLMYEASLQAMRVLLLRKGFGATEAEAEAALARGTPLHWAPILDLPSKLRCRGQVTEETRKVRYRLDLREIGRDPEPYAIAHAILYADERRIVRMGQATLRLAGAGRRPQPRTRARTEPELPPPLQPPATKPAFDAAAVDAYCDGRPSLCFGPSFAVFDEGPRRCARLPREPYKFLDRVTELSGTPGELRPGTTLVSEWDVDPRSWFFDAAGSPVVPHAVLLEAALQPCGFLAAFSGAPLRGEDLYFRNLEGVGTVHSEIRPDSGTLRCSVRALASSAAGGMILQQFAFDLRDGRGGKVYEATTRFGFFPREALAEQQGIRGAAERAWRLPMPDGGGGGGRLPLARGTGLRWSQLDRIEQLDVAGGPHGLGAAVASRRVDPEDWFFRAHFRDDPVMPGSLGVEAFLQLLEELARARWPELADSHRVEAPALGAPHRWTYRGQVLRTAGEIRVEAVVTRVAGDDGPAPLLAGSGFLHVDGLPIYELIDYAIRLVPRDSPGHAP
jgi:3-hydroxymyristoyl/3-hydroxydecanoyl-(acyl carrier protein) dehydratase